MATTRNFTIGPSWTRIATGRGDAQVVQVEASGNYSVAVTIGDKNTPPDMPTGHRIIGRTSIPLVAAQHLLASAETSKLITVT